MILKQIFKDCRIIGLAGHKNTGKTNNLIYLLNQLKNKEINVYFYGMNEATTEYLLKKGYKEISSIEHLVDKKDCLIILDEFQQLKLNDRRNKDTLNKIIDFVYHNNIYLILSSPNIREFNSIIGGVIEKWLIKTIYLKDCINGSQLKEVVNNYKGRYKQLDNIILTKNQLLIINKDYEKIINCKYIKEVDKKKDNKNIF